MDQTRRLALPYLAAAQSQKHVTHNEALRRLDGLAQIGVAERNRGAPPEAPDEGVSYLVGANPAGAFAGHAGELATFDDGSWRFHMPRAGWLCFVAAEAILLVHDGQVWRDWSSLIGSLANLQGLALGTGPDPANPLSVKANDLLFAARAVTEGGSGTLRMKLNKERAGATVSQLYQSSWSGRAETGLCGDDSFRVKVSADGATWRDSLVADPVTGAVAFPSGVRDLGGGGLCLFRNHVVNGDFSVAQRGNGPWPTGTAASYALDRWLTQAAAPVTGQVVRNAFAPGQTDVAGARFFLTLLFTAATAAAGATLETRLEDVTRLAGRTVTLSFVYRASLDGGRCELVQAFGTGGSTPVAGLGISLLPAAAGWTRRSVTLAMPPLTAKTIGTGSFTAIRVSPPGAAGTLDLADVQLEEGAVATAFARRPPSLELLLARRYFRRSAAALQAADLALEMRVPPALQGTGPFDYWAEL